MNEPYVNGKKSRAIQLRVRGPEISAVRASLMFPQELIDAGGDAEALGALARSGDRAALSDALKALGFSKLGQRLRIEKALAEESRGPADEDARAKTPVDASAFWQEIAQASADVLGAGPGGASPACDYAAHAASVAAEAAAARRRQAAADEARAEASERAAAELAASSTWGAGSGILPAIRSGFLSAEVKYHLFIQMRITYTSL